MEYTYRGEEREKAPIQTTFVDFAPFVKIIRRKAFFQCMSLTNIDIPLSVETIEEEAFEQCSSLREITIPPSVTKIGRYAFDQCSSLTRIDIPPSIESLEEGIFLRCLSLKRINIPPSVKTIKRCAFSECSSLTSIDIPPLLEIIEEYTFHLCSSLTSIHIPSSVKSVREYSFIGCSSLKKVHLSKSSVFHEASFPYTTKLIYGWNEVGPYILLRYLTKSNRATIHQRNDNDTDLSIIQKFIISTNDDIFRNVLEYLFRNETFSTSYCVHGSFRAIDEYDSDFSETYRRGEEESEDSGD